MEAVDILADAWLAEHADVSTSTVMQPTEIGQPAGTVQVDDMGELPKAVVTAPETDSSNSEMNDFTDRWVDEEPELSRFRAFFCT